MLDLAPSYGIEHEAEVVAGEALRNRSSAEVMITTKVELADDEPGDLTDRMIKSLEASLGRSGTDRRRRPPPGGSAVVLRSQLATSRCTADSEHRWASTSP
jgi:hypothetical protein